MHWRLHRRRRRHPTFILARVRMPFTRARDDCATQIEFGTAQRGLHSKRG